MKKVKWIKKIRWTDIRILIVLVLTLALYSFTNKRNEDRQIKDIEVRFQGSNSFFVTTQDVNNLLIQNFPMTSIITKSTLDLNKLEGELQSSKMIQNAEVYVTVDGKLRADVWQKRAIGRVVNATESFYIDSHGERMPLSKNFAARVPIVEGRLEENDLKEVSELLKTIDEDAYLKMNITGIKIDSKGEIVMRSRAQNFQILFGDYEEAVRKFENYKAFMHFVSNDRELLESYKTINLKFTQQVVCTK